MLLYKINGYDDFYIYFYFKTHLFIRFVQIDSKHCYELIWPKQLELWSQHLLSSKLVGIKPTKQ